MRASRPGWSLLACRPGLASCAGGSDRPLKPCRARSTLCSRRSRGSNRTLRARLAHLSSRPSWSLRSGRACGSLRTSDALCSGCSLRPSLPCGPLGSGRSGGSSRPLDIPRVKMLVRKAAARRADDAGNTVGVIDTGVDGVRGSCLRDADGCRQRHCDQAHSVPRGCFHLRSYCRHSKPPFDRAPGNSGFGIMPRPVQARRRPP